MYSYTYIKKQIPEEHSTVHKMGCENIIAREILFCGVMRNYYVSQNINAITRTLLLNRIHFVVCI